MRALSAAVAGTVVVGGFVQYRHAEDARTRAQIETIGNALVRGDVGTATRAKPGSGRLSSQYFHGLWATRELAGSPEDSVADLRAGTDAASVKPPTCLIPTEQNHGILRTVDHTVLDAAYVCEVSRGRQHFGRVVIRQLDDGLVEVTFALGPHSLTRRILHHFRDADVTIDDRGVTYLS
ncbi:hypothetical protein [Cellulomonas pakistanensis]|uniref:Uncharacterized protein n=1 Tax=Cellulomonas pakistanensis TaxID=992287 RepID=A0A919U748_9CELL|nr:hypothetical protein [Cellulomonas pakistanensis]GIG37674.1 hypothetical protein Cpa01nite_30550 [Cellulomonas pakistanensis]